MPSTPTRHRTLTFKHTGRVRCHTGRVRYAPDLNSERFAEVSQHRTHAPDLDIESLKTEFALDAQLGRVRCHTGCVRCAPVANSENFSEKALSPDETHRTPGGNYFRVRCLNSDTSDLIPDASGFTSDVSGLYALHEMNSNFFSCFHVPTPKCHNTCGSVLAFS